MTDSVGKFVTIVKREYYTPETTALRWWQVPPYRPVPRDLIDYNKQSLWCNNNVGRIGADWGYFPESKTFVFSNPEDATLFKLRFKL